MDDPAERMTPEQREFLEQRRREVARELEELRAVRFGPLYDDPHERYQDLQDELSEIERQLGEGRT